MTVPHSPARMDRRSFLELAGALAAVAWSRRASAAGGRMIEKRIPRTGEALPAIGMGSWATFDVGDSDTARQPLREVLKLFVGAGVRLVDTSPMYGRAEAVLGELLAARDAPRVFMATKVWTDGRRAGEEQIARSMALLRVSALDLLQIHNLRDWAAHRQTLVELKDRGKVRYIGITHYTVSAYEDLERVIRAADWDFVQLNHSIATRTAEDRLLPLCADRGIAVLANRPFEEGSVFARVRGRALPPWASDFDCSSWAQFFLKYVISHPSVTCAIPATANPSHMADNLAGGNGRLPDERTRRQMAQYFESL
jgi:diketogulonate reductase-like aldo/keto reductase